MTFHKSYLLRLLTVIIFGTLSSVIGVKAQPITELRVIGNSVPFYFNTMQQFQSGITLNDWTTIRIRFQITGKTAWQVVALAVDPSIEHQDGAHSIPLTNFTITINKSSITATNTVPSYTTPFTPTTTEIPLIWGAVTNTLQVVTVDFKISYSISLAGLGSLPDGRYYVPLKMELKEMP